MAEANAKLLGAFHAPYTNNTRLSNLFRSELRFSCAYVAYWLNSMRSAIRSYGSFGGSAPCARSGCAATGPLANAFQLTDARR
jgi:hypothetical protein